MLREEVALEDLQNLLLVPSGRAQGGGLTKKKSQPNCIPPSPPLPTYGCIIRFAMGFLK